MKKVSKITSLAGIAVVAGFLAFIYFGSDKPSNMKNEILGKPAAISTYFNIKYPNEYKVFSISPEPSQELTTIENSEGKGFQIFSMPFDEEGPMTEERIRKDLPDAQINDSGLAELDGVKSLVFYGFDEDLGETFEVWSVYNGRLYQIMGKKVDEETIVKTLNTWQWK